MRGINNVGAITSVLRPTVDMQYSEFYRRCGEVTPDWAIADSYGPARA